MYSIFYDPTHTRPFNDNFNSWMSLARSAFKYSVSLSLSTCICMTSILKQTLYHSSVSFAPVWLHAQMCLAAVESLFKITAFIRIFTFFFSSNINSAPLIISFNRNLVSPILWLFNLPVFHVFPFTNEWISNDGSELCGFFFNLISIDSIVDTKR